MKKPAIILILALLFAMFALPLTHAEESDALKSELLPALTGKWYPQLLSFTDSDAWLEPANLIRFYATINEDGTAFLEHYDSELFYENTSTCIIGDIIDSGDNTYGIPCIDTGDGSTTLLMYMSDSNTLILYSDYSSSLLFMTKDVIPAVEPAPVVEDASEEAFFGTWTFSRGSIDGREIDTSICYIPVYAGQLWEIYGDEIYVDSSCVLAVNETIWDGTSLTMAGIDPSTETEASYTFTLRTDGTLCVNYKYIECTLEEYVIDPMTEYSDSETIMFVQNALNELGYECGTADGISGQKTANALSAYQTDNSLTVTGTITHETLESLR